MNNVPLKPSIRFAVLTRDNFTCQYCGAKAPFVKLHVDHIVPRALDGSNDMGNLITACSECNIGKGTTEIDMTILCDDETELFTDGIEIMTGATMTHAGKMYVRALIELFSFDVVYRAFMEELAKQEFVCEDEFRTYSLDCFVNLPGACARICNG